MLFSHKFFRIIFVSLCICSALSISVCIGWNWMRERYLGMVQTPPTKEESESVPEELLPIIPPVDDAGLTVISDTVDVENFLILGVDARRPGEFCRTDTMLLVSLNKATKKIVICSLLRDMLVSIEGYGRHRLNSAYAFGGIPLLTDTLRENLNIDVSACFLVNFQSFVAVVDLLGGVEMPLSAKEISRIKEICSVEGMATPQITPKNGLYHLNGGALLAYVRNRNTMNGDFDRTQNQRSVLRLLIDKAKTVSLLDIFRLLPEFLQNISTNVSQERLSSLTANLPEYFQYEVVMTKIPYSKTFSLITYNGMAVIDVDFAANIHHLSKEIYETEDF